MFGSKELFNLRNKLFPRNTLIKDMQFLSKYSVYLTIRKVMNANL